MSSKIFRNGKSTLKVQTLLFHTVRHNPVNDSIKIHKSIGENLYIDTLKNKAKPMAVNYLDGFACPTTFDKPVTTLIE